MTSEGFSPLDRWLPRFLFDTRQNRIVYALKAWLLVLLPSLILAGLVALLAGETAAPDFGQVGGSAALLLIVFAPVVETVAMTLPLLLLNRLLGPVPAILVSAIGWGIVHSLQATYWGLVIWWPFLVFSTALLVWRQRGLLLAMLLVATIHALQNSVAAAALLLAG